MCHTQWETQCDVMRVCKTNKRHTKIDLKELLREGLLRTQVDNGVLCLLMREKQKSWKGKMNSFRSMQESQLQKS